MTWIKLFLKQTQAWKENALVLRELKHFKGLTIAAVLFSVFGAIFEGGTVGIIASFLQGLTNPAEPSLQTGLRWFDVIFLATEALPAERIYRLSAFILILIWLRAVSAYFSLLLSRIVTFRLVERLRRRVFEQLQKVSLSFYAKTRGSDLVSSVTSEVNQIQQIFGIFTTFLTQGTT